MSFGVKLTSTDIDRQIHILKQFPEIASKHFKPGLKRSAEALAGKISPNIPELTGRARKAFGSKVLGTKIESLKAQVGWYDKDDPWYINIVEYGARPHRLTSGSNSRSKRAQAEIERGEGGGGGSQPVYILNVGWRRMGIHPGFSKRGFMLAGLSGAWPVVKTELEQANESIVKELAL